METINVYGNSDYRMVFEKHEKHVEIWMEKIDDPDVRLAEMKLPYFEFKQQFPVQARKLLEV